MGCVDVTVEGLRIELTGGDGISVWTGHRYNGRKYPAPPPPGACVGNADCACVNLLIRDVICDRNYRAPSPLYTVSLRHGSGPWLFALAPCEWLVCAGQGMSVMLAQNLRVINSTFSNTAGTLPAAGLDSAHQPFS